MRCAWICSKGFPVRPCRASLTALTVLSTGLLVVTQAQAQTQAQSTVASSSPPSQEQATAIDDVVVTAARTRLPASALPLTVDIIDSQSLDEQAAISGSVVDAVATLSASFSPTTQKLTGGGESLRGRAPLYTINGIPQTAPLRDTSRDGYTIDPFFVDRVELIYGSNALQGIGATGGVVNQVTVSAPTKDGWSGRTLAQLTSAGGLQSDSFGGKIAGLAAYRQDPFDGLFGVAFDRRGAFYDGDGRRVGVINGQGDVQNSEALSFFSRFGWDVTPDLRLDLMASRFELKGNGKYVVVPGDRLTGRPTSSQRGTTEGEASANRVQTYSASLTHQDLWGGVMNAQLFYNATRDLFGGDRSRTYQDASIAPIGTLWDQTASQSRKRGARLNYERDIPGVPGLTATVGVDALQDRVRQDLIVYKRTWVPEIDYRSLAPFVQANLSLFNDRLRLAGGVRQENVDLSIEDFTTLAVYGSRAVQGGKPSFSSRLANGGIVYEPIDGLRTYASYAQGYTMADIGRILRAIDTDGVQVESFLNISPVVSDNKEIGVEWKRGAFELGASYFWSSSKLGQFFVRDADGSFVVLRQPVDIEGLELNGRVQTPVDGLVLSAGYARLRGRTDSNGDGIFDKDLDGSNISPDRINLAAIYSQGPLSARLQVQSYLKRSFAGGDPRNDFGGYTLADAYVRYETAIGGLSLAVQNLFDKQYINYASDTANPTDNLRYFAGRGRAFTLTWDRRF